MEVFAHHQVPMASNDPPPPRTTGSSNSTRRAQKTSGPLLDWTLGRGPATPPFAAPLEAVLRESLGGRSDGLKLHRSRARPQPRWFHAPTWRGYVFYATLRGRPRGGRQRLDYLAELGITYIHVMALPDAAPRRQRGGYSVMDYTRIDPRLGTMAVFREASARRPRPEACPSADWR